MEQGPLKHAWGLVNKSASEGPLVKDVVFGCLLEGPRNRLFPPALSY